MTGRYAIRLPDGSYVSNAKSWRGLKSAPLQKAKLWTNLGHVKTHLGATSTKYPPGSQVVEVKIVYDESVIDTVDSFVSEIQKRTAERKHESDVRYAKSALENAKRNLAEAKARMQKVAPP